MEHLLRDVKDATLSSLAGDVTSKLLALKGLQVCYRVLGGADAA